MFKGITPTITLTLPESVDLDSAQNVYVTFKDHDKKMTKTGSDISVEDNVVSVYLNQEETLSFCPGAVWIQVNWTYSEEGTIKRASSDIVSLIFRNGLERGVLA